MARRSKPGGRFKWAVLGALLALIGFFLVPIIFFQIYFSLHQWTVYLSEWWAADFVGLETFAEVFQDYRFLQAFIRSFIFAGSATFVSLVIGFILAFLMYQEFRGRTFFYLCFITPMLMVPIVIGYNFEMLLVEKGPLNQILTWLKGEPVRTAWLAEKVPAFLAIIFIEVWNWTPLVFIIILAGLAGMPREPIEAAQVLGASRWKVFREVQLPFLRPVIVLACILRFLEALAEFPKVWSLTTGGPGTFTETLPVYLYITSWEYFNVSKGAAMSYVVLVVIGLVIFTAIKILLREKRSLDIIFAKQS
ncbi:MAG: carbohydrate ABC transporter permease [Nitrospinota bacterium]